MPEEEYEVRGHHDAAIEEAAEHGAPFGRKVALFSALLATLGAVASFLGGHTQNEALYYKNDAVLQKARASDMWGYYQAEEVKRHLAETAAALAPNQAAKFAPDIAKYRARSRNLQRQAEELDRRSAESDAEAVRALAPHTKLALAVTFVQIAIALASIAALTARPWLLRAAGLFGLVGIALSLLAWL